MRIEDKRYMACEAIAPLVDNENLMLKKQTIGLSVMVDFADVKYIRRGIDNDGLPSDERSTLIFIEGELMDIEEPFENLFDAFLSYKRKWEYEIKD